MTTDPELNTLAERLRAAGYHVDEPITLQKRAEAAAGDFCFHAQRLRDLVAKEGAPISDHAERLIRIAADAIHHARARHEQREEAA